MSLSCSCDEDSDWYYFDPNDFSKLATKRGRRCCSCHALIAVGDDCARFERFRRPITEIEERIQGDDVPMADKYMCEECAGLYFSLSDLGFCINLGNESMKDLVREYAETYGPQQPPARSTGSEK